jgi:heteromeric Ino2p/Ino4p transcription factor
MASSKPSGSDANSGGDSANASKNGVNKPRLTAQQKRDNHINSESKRRDTIRDKFDRICEIVPGLEGKGRSEGVVLEQTNVFIDQQLVARRMMIAAIESLGGTVDPEHKAAIEHLSNWEPPKEESPQDDDGSPQLDANSPQTTASSPPAHGSSARTGSNAARARKRVSRARGGSSRARGGSSQAGGRASPDDNGPSQPAGSP